MRESPGQLAYEADLVKRPTYNDGSQRKAWWDLGEVERWSWEREPLFDLVKRIQEKETRTA